MGHLGKPKGVGAGRGGGAPSYGKLTHKLILVFPKKPFKQHFMITFYKFGRGGTHPAELYADKSLLMDSVSRSDAH